jgi:hypothetical protein
MVVVGVLAVAVAFRASFLLWSPLPATLDGFRYARLAEAVLAGGDAFAADVESDELVTAWTLAAASAVVDVGPLHLAQPFVACLGGASALSGLVFVRLLGRSLGWPDRRTRHAAVLAGLALAVEGLYLRRSGVPDEEAIGLLLVPLFALAGHRTIASRRRAWAAVFVLLAAVYPALHNLSAMIAALTLTALAALYVQRRPARDSVVVAGGMAVAFWGHFFGYYAVADRLGLGLTYTGIVRDHPGAFLAWIVLLAVGAAWLASTKGRFQRSTLGVGFGLLFVAASANVVQPLFPGTVRTPALVLALVVPFLLPVALVAWGLPAVLRRGGDGPGRSGDGFVVVALLLGPLAMVWYGLTTSLTPDFFGMINRAQSFAHVAVFALAAVVAVEATVRRRRVGQVLVVGLALVAVVSVPLGFVHLDTGTAPRTVHESEFGAARVAGSGGNYTSEHRLARLWGLYYGAERGEIGSTRSWVGGGAPPGCPTLATEEWTRSAAHFYPSEPLRLPAERYDAWKTDGNLVYSADGYTDVSVVVPPGDRSC